MLPSTTFGQCRETLVDVEAVSVAHASPVIKIILCHLAGKINSAGRYILNIEFNS